MKTTCIVLSLLAPAAAFVVPSAPQTSTRLSATSRADFLRDVTTAVVGVTAAAVVQQPFPAFADETLPSGVAIKVVKDGQGPRPDIGELAGIRFSAYAGDNKIDDIFGTPEPYYTRIGSGGLIKGVEEVLPKMRVGDRWILTVPVS